MILGGVEGRSFGCSEMEVMGGRARTAQRMDGSREMGS